MTIRKSLALASLCMFISAHSFGSCGVVNAKVIDVQQYYDGKIFVQFDKPTTCDCTQTERLAFDSSDPGKDFIKSMVLMAFASNSNVNAYANSETCSVHGNTPVMDYFRLLK